jgi:hypothetical protein
MRRAPHSVIRSTQTLKSIALQSYRPVIMDARISRGGKVLAGVGQQRALIDGSPPQRDPHSSGSQRLLTYPASTGRVTPVT